jgi:hypothetical protein
MLTVKGSLSPRILCSFSLHSPDSREVILSVWNFPAGCAHLQASSLPYPADQSPASLSFAVTEGVEVAPVDFVFSL